MTLQSINSIANIKNQLKMYKVTWEITIITRMVGGTCTFIRTQISKNNDLKTERIIVVDCRHDYSFLYNVP